MDFRFDEQQLELRDSVRRFCVARFVQVHGGMGFTWEMLPNYLLKRAWVLEHLFGSGDVHALALGVRLEEASA